MRTGLTDFLRGFTIICQNAIHAVIDFAHDTKLQHFTFLQATAINEYLSKESSDRHNGATILALLTRPFLSLFEHQKGKAEIENVVDNFDWYMEIQRQRQQETIRYRPSFRR
jgi:plasmid recombination enzyme